MFGQMVWIWLFFEEFGAGSPKTFGGYGSKKRTLMDSDYRKRIPKQWDKMFSPRVYHRDFFRATIKKKCPEIVASRSDLFQIWLPRKQVSMKWMLF